MIKMRIQILVFSLSWIVVLCSVAREETTVSEEELAQGYACKSANKYVGLMKNGEKRTSFNPNICAGVTCVDGIIEMHSCGLRIGPKGCKAAQNVSKKYPECCGKIVC